MKEHSVSIPIPPSVNGLYVNAPGKGRRKTGKYKQWLAAALWPIKAGLPVLGTPISIEVRITGGRGFLIGSDVSNRIKAAEDALVKTGRIPDDNVRYVVDARATFTPGDGEAHCQLVVTELGETEAVR